MKFLIHLIHFQFWLSCILDLSQLIEVINMEKSFDDFISSLSDEDICNIADINQELANVRNTSAVENLFGNQIAVSSYLISLNLLRYYHEWLNA
ncbi:hypothetical protein FIU74_08615 [Lactobacillus buchneri]|nr:hypothetical protein [Lentilactobacillus buchneri]